MASPERALHRHFPGLASSVPFADLGSFPTPITRASDLETQIGVGSTGGQLWLKRDDRTSPVYGGNKVRTLEIVFGDALRRGLARVYATGAFGSNHAAATSLHARRVGLTPGAILFPQPISADAIENLRISLAHAEDVRELAHWSTLPLGVARVMARQRDATVMVPGAATPLGALGYVSAAFELAEQVAAGELPAPDEVVIAVGSTCTSAGLLLGFHLAGRRGFGFTRPPRLISVRVTPWPVTSPRRIIGLACETAALLERMTGEAAPSREQLSAGLRVDGRFLGAGYGEPTVGGLDAIARFGLGAGVPLDLGYSGKSAASFLARGRTADGRVRLFWATKSSAPTPDLPSIASLAWDRRVGRRMQAFLQAGIADPRAAERVAIGR